MELTPGPLAAAPNAYCMVSTVAVDINVDVLLKLPNIFFSLTASVAVRHEPNGQLLLHELGLQVLADGVQQLD